MMEGEISRRAVNIKAANLRVAYKDFVALQTPSLDISGNIISVIGHNGAGKSTFIKSILGLLQPSEGSLGAWNVEEGNSYRLVPEQDMAFCPEIGAVFADISVESYVKLWCRIKHRDGKFYKKGGAKYIDLLQLSPLMKKLGRELSKGQRRRVQTAIGFLVRPKLFLFDEPFDGLDVQKTSELAEIIREESLHTSFIISSHRMDVVERLSDLLIVLKEGSIVASGAVEAVCPKLCGRSVMVSTLRDPVELLQKLRDAFPECLSNCIGHQITVTGETIDVAQVSKILGADQDGGIRIDETQPSLVDAMNFHLKSLSSYREARD
jgi:ABC-2 type transport system ATP-binding protein